MGPWSFQKSRMSKIDRILFGKSTRFLPWAVMTVAWYSRRGRQRLSKRIQPGHETGEPHQLAIPPEAHEGEAFQTAVH